jgi:hypothetical protein
LKKYVEDYNTVNSKRDFSGLVLESILPSLELLVKKHLKDANSYLSIFDMNESFFRLALIKREAQKEINKIFQW